MKSMVLWILKVYKKYLSFGNNCRFYPTCSVYTYLAVEKYGVTKGLYLGLRRVVKCGFWHKGGIDMLD